MRIFGGIVFGILLVTAAVYRSETNQGAETKVVSDSPAELLGSNSNTQSNSISKPVHAESVVVEKAATKPELAETSDEDRIAAIQDLGTSSNLESLQEIVSNFKDSNPQIRKAAVEATMQFGNKDAIPDLEQMVGDIEDPREKVEILDAIEFLKLPSLAEIRHPR
jgi:HEAT repeat protein